MDTIKAKDLLDIVEQIVAIDGGDMEIVSITWRERNLGGDFDVKVETLRTWPPQPAPNTTEIREGGAGR